MVQALSGLKVLDLSMNLPGPYMTWLLAMLGAEIVKIENPVGGDYARALGSGGQESPYFAAVNRNKKSVSLNLKHPEGKRIFLDLLDHYDTLVEGFRPGTMERLGLGYSDTSARNPRLIHVSITGYGHNGPNRLRAGHDLNYLSLAGIIGMTGTRDGQPVVPGVQIADLAGGALFGLVGLLAAVIQRERTGRGQFVDTAMFDGSLSLATMVFAGVGTGMETPLPGKMLLNGRFPCYGLYRTSDGQYMSLGAIEPKFWVNFCQAAGRPDLLNGQYAGENVVSEVAALFASRTREEWLEILKDADACCEPVLTLNEAVESPLVRARNMVNTSPQGHPVLACPLKLSESPVPEDCPAPDLGQNNQEILGKLGLQEKDLLELRSKGVI
ncbi:CaiB/BaiF CoA transferase family protein [Desulfomonile tiedjei]|uniref:Putative acyl-CoA transferase/carnitine dehydratase n=1 Tax=Desulfomonile tiedjei (strain ATCC 49306 / DSM 6799 / DCB-1) TaxID=706587 RepID=I4C3Z5_DESTA|nr:CaiB/BaiF CoA-transferase family protein [Desulfomonile tiedjei]AFM24286.1 putative acyl-CoA transferase/carnitine dehydratase [Desulfomonile tiedjei DSM 6799]